MKIYTSTTAWAAQMLRDVLAADGIDTHVQESFDTLHRRQSFVVFLMDPDQAERAREIVADFRENASSEPLDERMLWKWRCPGCGEDVEPQFQQCWKCQTEKPARA